jgi:Na+/H+ antiporter NhaD/arsenite permease-like protein
MFFALADASGADKYVPDVFWVWPFIAILLAIALLPLIRRTHHWWEENRNKLLVALLLAGVTLAYYGLRGVGVEVHGKEPTGESHAALTMPEQAALKPAGGAIAGHETAAPGGKAAEAGHVGNRSAAGLETVWTVIEHAVLNEYVPFIVLLFSLYVISGGIVVRGDVRATPLANTCILGTGGLLASFIGTTGAAMLLIRFLLKTNSERKFKAHTVIFYIFIVANIGGSLLPIGDPPLFLGYLRGVPFFWTFNLWKCWGAMLIVLLIVYYFWDCWAYKREDVKDLKKDDAQIERLHAAGMINVLWLIGVVAAVALLDPSKAFPGTNWRPFPYLREIVQLAMALLSWATTRIALRKENQFNFVAIGEVACLFIGIFITMQAPIEILRARGAELGLHAPWHFFWASGILSSFLDNAPTYVVYFETASALPAGGFDPSLMMHGVATGSIAIPLLIAVSCGSVFMGANTYIGNGPNFMVKAIAEQSGVKMPSFFGYMVYSGMILIPLFIVLTLAFFVQ